MSNPYATECAIYRFFSEEFFSEDGVEKKPFLQSEGKKNLFLQASWFSPLSLPNSPKGCLTPLCQSAYSQEVAPNTCTPLKQGLEKP